MNTLAYYTTYVQVASSTADLILADGASLNIAPGSVELVIITAPKKRGTFCRQVVM